MEWIPINKDSPDKGDLPNIHDDVFVSIGDKVFEAFRSIDGDCWYLCGVEWDCIIGLEKADAWMSKKPKPYRG